MQRFNKIRKLLDQLEQEMMSLIEDRQELEENELSQRKPSWDCGCRKCMKCENFRR